MPDIKDILRNEDFGSIVGDLCVDTREDRNPREYMEEYEGDRTRRKESVGYRESKKIAVYSDTEKEVDLSLIHIYMCVLMTMMKLPRLILAGNYSQNRILD